jgi:hypothetical protein
MLDDMLVFQVSLLSLLSLCMYVCFLIHSQKQEMSATLQKHITKIAPENVKAASSSAARYAQRLQDVSSLKDVTERVIQKGSSGRSLVGDVLFSGIYSLAYHQQAQGFVNTVLTPILATAFSIFKGRERFSVFFALSICCWGDCVCLCASISILV